MEKSYDERNPQTPKPHQQSLAPRSLCRRVAIISATLQRVLSPSLLARLLLVAAAALIGGGEMFVRW